MRFQVRRTVALAAALTIIGFGLPGAAYASPSNDYCKQLYGPDVPPYMMCEEMASPDEVQDIVHFWLDDDGRNLKGANPYEQPVIDCSYQGTVCPEPEGDGAPGGEGDPVPDDYTEPDGAPECQPPDEACSYDGAKFTLTPEDTASAAASTDGQAVATAKDAGLRVWLDTELADDWKTGGDQFVAAVKKVAALAVQQGAVGIRFSSQLGYTDTFADATEIARFVGETSRALRVAAAGKKLAVHTLVPEFGCGGVAACKTAMAAKYPKLLPDQVESYLSSGAVDQVALDSGLMNGEYAAWKIGADKALANQWAQVRARAWDAYGHVAVEDAAFTAAGSSRLTDKQATQLIAERVTRPLVDDAAQTVNLWSRWQDASGQVHRIMGERNAANPTWAKITKLDEVRPRLATIYNPAAPEVDAATDLKKLSEAFGQVFLTTS